MHDVESRTIHLIGPGEVGGRIGVALESRGWRVNPVTRTRGWDRASDPGDPSPRLVAVREEDLSAVLERLGTDLRDRTVLVQNGFLEAVHGDLGAVTRGLIYFTSKGDFFEVLCASPFFGPYGEPLARALNEAGLTAEAIVDREEFLQAMIAKGIWNVVVGLPLAIHRLDLGTYLSSRRHEFHALVEESARAAGAAYRCDVDPDTVATKILETTETLSWVGGGTKALPWRNGAIARFGREHSIPTPINDGLLLAAGYEENRCGLNS